MSDPFSKIYVVTEPLESLPVLLLFFVIIYMSKFSFDAQFSTLVRRKSAYALDGMPFVVGLWTLLRQFHPAYTRMFLAYLGQFVRATVGDAVARADITSSKASLPGEITNTLLFLDMFCKVGEIPRSALAEYIPPHIMHM
jgi:WASH complex subunit strumpellin